MALYSNLSTIGKYDWVLISALKRMPVKNTRNFYQRKGYFSVILFPWQVAYFFDRKKEPEKTKDILDLQIHATLNFI